MRREELKELQYLAPIVNVPSILSRGIVSHKLAETIPHQSVAMQEVQDRRTTKIVPGAGGRTWHDYANVYLSASNPMLYQRKDAHTEICVLRISTTIVDLNGVILTDRNAAATIAIFRPATAGLFPLDREQVLANDWRHPGDPLEYQRHRSIKCAEVLVPNQIPPTYILGAYVSCMQSQANRSTIAPNLRITVNSHLFFREVEP